MLRQFLKEEEGQTTVEYIMIIAVVVLVISLFGSKISKLTAEVTDQVFKGVKDQVSRLMQGSR